MDPSAQLTVRGDLGDYVLFGCKVAPSPEEMADVFGVILMRIHHDLNYITPSIAAELFPGMRFSTEQLKTSRCALLVDQPSPPVNRLVALLVREGHLAAGYERNGDLILTLLDSRELLINALHDHSSLGLLIFDGLITHYRRVVHEREKRARILATTLEALESTGQRLALPPH